MYSQFSLFLVVRFYKVAKSTELAHTEPLFPEEIHTYRYTSHKDYNPSWKIVFSLFCKTDIAI